MKSRIGFVSNSSSASFVIHWRVRSYGYDISVPDAIGRIFDVDYEEGIKGETWAEDKYIDPMTNLNRFTHKNSDGSFTTIFGTTMFNDYEDFGKDAMFLCTALVGSDRFEIIDAKIEKDS